MILVFLGPPGCGKGTQSEYLVKHKEFKHVSTGDLLRAEVKAGTDLGKQIESLLASGALVPSEIVIELLKKSLDFSRGVRLLLDGFPRTLDQALTLDKMLEDVGSSVHSVINFSISEQELYSRIAGRFSCASCGMIYHDPHMLPEKEGVCDKCHGTEFKKRSDDTAQALSERLKEFEAVTAPLKQYYQDKGILNNVDAAKSVQQIREEISVFIKS